MRGHAGDGDREQLTSAGQGAIERVAGVPPSHDFQMFPMFWAVTADYLL